MRTSIIIIAVLSSIHALAQNVNWHSINDTQKSIAFLNFGYDFGVTTELGYGYKINTIKPIILKTDFSFPMGEDLLDDYKVRLGAQVLVFEKNNILITAKVNAIFRKQETNLVQLASFGSDLTILMGFYKPSWQLAGEIGMDKSNQTYLKHMKGYRDNYPSAKNAWFVNSGGHFFYGIQGSKTIGKRLDISFRLGAINALSDNQNALIPFYFQLGLGFSL